MSKVNEKVTIIGAGLAGSYLASLLATEGFQVEIFERRPDMRKAGAEGGRSINLAISKRGLDALNRIGLKEPLKDKLIPMKGRQIHHLDDSESFQIYSTHQGEGINSVSRSGLNMLLMDHAEGTGRVKINFESSVTKVDFSLRKKL